MRGKTREEAVMFLLNLTDQVNLLVQQNKKGTIVYLNKSANSNSDHTSTGCIILLFI